jgi:choline dehydrogenase
LNAPTIMLAERAADLIKGHSLPPETVTTTGHSQWKTQQRASQPKR